ncbi:MAG: restriction endonuclease subunit S [Agrobacterium albertimagni]
MNASSTLGDFFSIRKEKGEAGLPTLSVTMNDGLVDRADLDRKMETNLTPEEHLRVREGDIAYNMMRMWQGAFGRAEKDGIVSPAYVVAEPRKNMDSRFAAHWFKSERMLYLFWAYSYGLTQDRLRLYADDFCQIPAAPPSLSEQKEAAEALDRYDTFIAQGEALAAAKRRCFNWLFSQLFPTSGTLLPDGWSTAPITSVAKIRFSGIDKKTAEGETPVLLCNYTDVFNNRRITADLPFMEATAKPREIEAFTLRQGDVVFTKDSETAEDIGASAVVAEPLDNVICGYHLAVARAKPKQVTGDYLAYALRHPWVREEFRKAANGVTRFGLNLDVMDQVHVLVPSLERQRAIAAALHAVEDEIDLLTKYATALRLQKKALMQRLFGGDSVAAKAAAE